MIKLDNLKVKLLLIAKMNGPLEIYWFRMISIQIHRPHLPKTMKMNKKYQKLSTYENVKLRLPVFNYRKNSLKKKQSTIT
jgi:hypothetical protein